QARMDWKSVLRGRRSLEAASEVLHPLLDLLVRVGILAPSLALGLPPVAEVPLLADSLHAAHQIDLPGGADIQVLAEMAQPFVQGVPTLAGGNERRPAVSGLLRQAIDEDRIGMVGPQLLVGEILLAQQSEEHSGDLVGMPSRVGKPPFGYLPTRKQLDHLFA